MEPPHDKALKSPVEIVEGDMPPSLYLLLHPRAHLSNEEEQALVDGMRRTLGLREH